MMEQLIGSILANRLRYFLVALAVAVASAFTVVSLTLADYTDTALRGSRTANFGRAQAAVKIADASDGRDAAQAVERLDSVSKAYAEQTHRAAITRTTGSTQLSVSAAPDGDFAFYRLTEGSMPRLTNEIAVSEKTAKSRDLSVGDTMTVTVYYTTSDSADPQSFSIGMRVTGIYRQLHRPASATSVFTGYITPEAAKEWRNREGRDSTDADTTIYTIGAAGHSDAEMLAELSSIPGASVQSRLDERGREPEDKLARAGSGAIAAMSAFALFSLALAGAASWSAFRAVSASRRRQLALLKALGASSRRVHRLILTEAVVVGALASAGGVALGMSLAKLIPSVVVDNPSTAVLPTNVETNPFNGLLALAAGTLVTFAAAVPFALRSHEIKPLEAIADSPHPSTSGERRIRPATAYGLVVGGAAIATVGAFLPEAGSGIAGVGACFVAIGAMSIFSGIVALAPSISHLLGIPLALFIGRRLRRGRRSIASAFKDISNRANPGRTIIVAFFVSTCLLSSVAVIVEAAQANVYSALDTSFSYDVEVRQESSSTDGVGGQITASQRKAAAANSNVAAVAPVYETTADSDIGKLKLVALDPARASSLIKGNSRSAISKTGRITLPESKRTLVNQKSLVLTGRNGKSITLSVSFGDVASPTISLSDMRKVDDAGGPTALWLKTEDGKPTIEAVQSIRHDVDEASGDALPTVTSAPLRQRVAYGTAADSIAGISFFALAGLSAVSALGASTAIARSIRLRWRESKILRAAGESASSVRRDVTIYEFSLASSGILLGSALGVVVSLGLCAGFFSRIMDGTQIGVPIKGLVTMLAAGIATTAIVIYFTLKTLTGRHFGPFRMANGVQA
jgi:Predicted ABC-type transport system involved in lysophospholipase L1 biosynthesis, permease component